MRWQRWWLLAGMLGMLSGCATQGPPIPAAPENNPSIGQVHAQPSDYRGLAVRWGGTIVEVENREQSTVLLIMGRPVDEEGVPQIEAASQGRFMAKVDGFLDPVVYSPGRAVTVFGTLVGSESRKIGGYSYVYPVVAAEQYHLWPRPREVERYDACSSRLGSPSSFFYPWYRFGYGMGYGYGWPGAYCW